MEFADGTTQVLVKPAPVQAHPDPAAGGHLRAAGPGPRQDDGGAMGAAGVEAPLEKDVNLAVAQAPATVWNSWVPRCT